MTCRGEINRHCLGSATLPNSYEHVVESSLLGDGNECPPELDDLTRRHEHSPQ
jgi:hypothetical protein